MFSFEHYHQQSKQRARKLPQVLAVDRWPESWRTINVKTYPRFTTHPLPSPCVLSQSISESLTNRHSSRKFVNEITTEKLSSLLYHSIGEKMLKEGEGSQRRMYPSAGARYPLEFYILNFKLSFLPEGVYHYNITDHALVELDQMNITQEIFDSISLEKGQQKPSFLVAFTATMSRTSVKYGESAYRFTLLEAGAAMQNLSLVSTALNINAISIGGTIEDSLEKLIGVDGVHESIVHTMYFG